ncbi:MAG: hypothetical protein V3T05_13225 [Myxococcota bacterium]
MIITAYGDVVDLSDALRNDLVLRVLDQPCSTARLLEAVDEGLAVHDARTGRG